jgi:ureidoacrylate peracid hydrolase
MKTLSRRSFVMSAAIAGAVICTNAWAEPLPPLATTLKPQETAILLVDFQGNFTSPDGAWYGKLKAHYEKTHMLERTVELVKKARAKGALVVHITEGYSQDYRELDPTNPGLFHRGQINRSAWKIGSKEATYYEPLKPGPGDHDIVLPPRIQVSGFGGTGLNDILRAKGIKNVAVAGFTSDVCVYATVLAAYDLGYHVYALKEGTVGFYEPMSEMMLNTVFPMWSQVVGHDEFDAMLQASTTSGQASAK